MNRFSEDIVDTKVCMSYKSFSYSFYRLSTGRQKNKFKDGMGAISYSFHRLSMERQENKFKNEMGAKVIDMYTKISC